MNRELLEFAAELILADPVKRRAAGELAGAPPVLKERHTAIDPVCHMEVEIATARWIADHEGETFYFYAPGCKASFERTGRLHYGLTEE